MKKLISFRLSFAVLSFIFMFSIAAMSQPVQYERSRCWLTVEDTTIVRVPPINNSNYTTLSGLNTIFRNNGVLKFEQAVPFAKSKFLRQLYEVEVSGSIDAFIESVSRSKYSSYLQGFSKFRIEKYEEVYDPSDYFWDPNLNYSWHLRNIEADKAWDITQGSPDVFIAVIDWRVDIYHPDLRSKIKYDYDPYRKFKFTREIRSHGTTVSGFAAAETAQRGTQSEGASLSLGFNTRLINYESPPGDTKEFLQRALHASTVEHADVIVCCAGGGIFNWSCGADIEKAFVKEILDNGTVIVSPAGNGIGDGGKNIDPVTKKFIPHYPFHPSYDERIIIVSSTGPGDTFTYSTTEKDIYHSYFPEVDVCAPGHNLTGCTSTGVEGNPFTFIEWPYYEGYGGTSFSAPITAALAALIKSIDKRFSPAEIKHIIKITTDPILDANKYKDESGRSCTGTGRINAYKAVQLAKKFQQGNYCYPNIFPSFLSTGTIKDSATIYGSLIIDQGQTLIIEGTLKFTPNSGIIVKRGGKLIVNGGKLTSSGAHYWKGIEVWGTKSTVTPSDSQRGVLELRNAIIEKADIAVLNSQRVRDTDLGDYDPADYPEIIFSVSKTRIVPGESIILPYGVFTGTTGGKITAENTSFINNRASVAFYDNSTKGSGSFTGCRFIYNSDLGPYRQQGKAMVHLYNVKNIHFKGCEFVNELYRPNGIGDHKLPTGIYSYNSSFTVSNRCTHLGNTLVHTGECIDQSGYSIFKGLSYGIYSINSGGSESYTVKRTIFSDINSGIYNGGVNNISVTDCIFTIQFGAGRPNYCIYLNGSTNYKIENNTFKTYTTTGKLSNTYGLVINNSGESVNRIYNNSFNNLDRAIHCQGINKNRTTGIGLCFICNDFYQNAKDLSILATTGLPQTNGVSTIQKNGNNPASNTFSQDTSWNIYNNCNAIDYWSHNWNSGDKKLIPDRNHTEVTVKVTKQKYYPTYDKQRDCPRSQQTGITPPEIVVKLEDYKKKSLLLQNELKEKTDGGNTEELINIINNSNETDSPQLKSVLITNSPYLSDEAVKAGVLNEEAISNATLRDIIIRNSHTSKNPEIKEAVKNRTNPMPDYMLSQIEAATNNISEKEILTENLQKELINYADMLNTVLNEAVEDNNTQLWESIMDNSITDDIKYDYLMYNILKGDNEKADLIRTSMTQQSNEYESYKKYLELLTPEIIKGRLTDSIVELLTEIASSDSKSGLMATGILTNFGYMKYVEPFYFEEVSNVPVFKNTINTTKSNNIFTETKNLKVYPNPANDYITVKYNSDLYSENINFVITNMKGTIVQSIQIMNTNDNFKINIKGLAKGNYILSLLFEGQQVESIKFTIK